MEAELCRHARLSVTGNVAGRGREAPPQASQAAHHEGTVGNLAGPDGNIHGHGGPQHALNADRYTQTRVRRQERRHRRHDAGIDQRGMERHHHVARHSVITLIKFRAAQVQGLQCLTAMQGKTLTLFRDVEGTRGPVHKPRAQAALQACQPLADGVDGNALSRGGGGQRSGVDHMEERPEVFHRAEGSRISCVRSAAPYRMLVPQPGGSTP